MIAFIRIYYWKKEKFSKIKILSYWKDIWFANFVSILEYIYAILMDMNKTKNSKLQVFLVSFT